MIILINYYYFMKSVRFSLDSFKKNDQVAKETTIKALKQVYEKTNPDLLIEENTNRYGIDLLLSINGRAVAYAECERSSCWSTGKFPFKCVRLPNRKFHFLVGKDAGNQDLPNGPLPIIFVMTSLDNKSLIMYTDETARASKEEVVYNTRTGAETMKIIPKDKAFEVTLA